ncbi:glycosyltransferase family 9 protein [Prosthecochloris sp. SCSIO W1103]|uniref:glycosyltransferase family 9 protein n=1 Tax=Prosthecochloris sp. SCSIO W1103 TaxID=2992244 RepID=UPI00223E05D9|nr:glycosyltransferase family 9 protein [Prosthecochloris sp. SCSIO W1103]UZJ37307.1 glycosyltransferase family 9 protein [Prosthecochloris sp. SCSIO W1103]
MIKDWKKKRRFRQALASTLQKIFCKPERQPPYTGPLESIAILAQEKYGDAILLTPLLKNLKQCIPSCSIHLITFSKAIASFFQNDPNVTAVHYAKGNVIRYTCKTLAPKFDLLFNTKDHPSTNFLLQSILIRARCKVGIANEFHTGLFDYLVDTDFHTHIVRKNCGLLTILGLKIAEESCRPYIPPMSVSEEIEMFAASLEPKMASGINISAGGPTRYWTEENWSEIIAAFPVHRFVIFSTPTDIDQKRRLEDRHQNVIASPGTANLLETGRIVKQIGLLISPDTAMIHVASCYNVPVIALYGQATQDQKRFGPFFIKNKMVISPTAKVQDIAVSSVANAFKEFMKDITS